MDRCSRLETIVNNPKVLELLQFYNEHEKILAPFQFINDNELDFNVENVDEIFSIPNIDINTDPADPVLLQELIEIVEETREVTTKLVYFHAVNFELISTYNRFLMTKAKHLS